MIIKKNRLRKGNVKKEPAGMQWLMRPGKLLYRMLPFGLTKLLFSEVKKYIGKRQMESEEQTYKRCGRFLIEELSVLFWGMIFTLLLAAAFMGRRYFADKSITLSRNPFGKGGKEQQLVLSNDEGRRTVSVMIEEQQASAEEIEALYRDFFDELKRRMCGENESLQHVNLPLSFDEELDGYPFEIEYQPEELSLLGLTGEPGEEAMKLKEGEIRETTVKVTASYKTWKKSRSFRIVLTAPKKSENVSAYDKAAGQIRDMELNSRKKAAIIIPNRLGDVTIQIPGSDGYLYGLIFLAAMGPLALIFCRYNKLKENEQKMRKEEDEDFPVIVHLLTLYMKAGLSFSSAIHRISRSYNTSEGTNSRRYAFEEISLIDNQLKMGVSQKEVCISWGKRSGNLLYQKLSAALIQIIVKGSKEGDRILEHMEREAFEQRIDRVRKEGKKTETRLIFPMIILLCLVMMIVLFPALIRFRGF